MDDGSMKIDTWIR